MKERGREKENSNLPRCGESEREPALVPPRLVEEEARQVEHEQRGLHVRREERLAKQMTVTESCRRYSLSFRCGNSL